MSPGSPLNKRPRSPKRDSSSTDGPVAEVPELKPGLKPELKIDTFEGFVAADELPLKASAEFKANLRVTLQKLVKNLYAIGLLFLGGPTPYN